VRDILKKDAEGTWRRILSLVKKLWINGVVNRQNYAAY
jgi:hypothetical protein